MKLFETFRTNVALIGITSNVNASANSFDFGRKYLISVITWSIGILGWIFLICEANTFIELTTTIYIASACTVVAISFTIVIFQTSNIFKFADGCERVIVDLCEIIVENGTEITLLEFWSSHGDFDNRIFFSEMESKMIFKRINRQIEKWCGIVYFVVAKMTPIFWISPKLIYSLIVYFTTDLGNEAFELPYPEWYVIQNYSFILILLKLYLIS